MGSLNFQRDRTEIPSGSTRCEGATRGISTAFSPKKRCRNEPPPRRDSCSCPRETLFFSFASSRFIQRAESRAEPLSTGRFQTVNYTTTSVIQPLGFVTTRDRDPFLCDSQSDSRAAQKRVGMKVDESAHFCPLWRESRRVVFSTIAAARPIRESINAVVNQQLTGGERRNTAVGSANSIEFPAVSLFRDEEGSPAQSIRAASRILPIRDGGSGRSDRVSSRGIASDRSGCTKDRNYPTSERGEFN